MSPEYNFKLVIRTEDKSDADQLAKFISKIAGVESITPEGWQDLPKTPEGAVDINAIIEKGPLRFHIIEEQGKMFAEVPFYRRLPVARLEQTLQWRNSKTTVRKEETAEGTITRFSMETLTPDNSFEPKTE